MSNSFTSPVPPDWATLRRDFDAARRECASAFTALLRAVEEQGGRPTPQDLARWIAARERRNAVDRSIEQYVQLRL